MRIVPALLVALLGHSVSLACINVSGVNGPGRQIDVDETMLLYSKTGLLEAQTVRTFWAQKATELEARMAANPSTRDRSDYGGVLLHLRQFEKGRDVLLEAERLAPKDYAVASNLGAAYELLGDVPKALEWIAKGMERNPQSHRGTEWVHLKILQAKLMVKRDPTWLKTRSVLGIDFGNEPRPALPGKPDAVRQESYRIIQAAGYQLSERMNFVAAPDLIVGDLLFDLGNAFLMYGAAETATGVLELAQEYGAARKELLAKRLQFARQLSSK